MLNKKTPVFIFTLIILFFRGEGAFASSPPKTPQKNQSISVQFQALNDQKKPLFELSFDGPFFKKIEADFKKIDQSLTLNCQCSGTFYPLKAASLRVLIDLECGENEFKEKTHLGPFILSSKDPNEKNQRFIYLHRSYPKLILKLKELSF